MDFSHYTDAPVELAVALVNTDQRYDGSDRIAELEGLRSFLEEWRQLWEGEAQDPTDADLPVVHRLRGDLRSVFEAGDEEASAQILNRLLAEHGALPRVSTHSGHPHLHFEPTGSAMGQWLGVVTAMGLATVLVEEGLERFGSCASDTCRDVFVDTSRNRSRRHCSTTCATREAVAAYRRRHRTE